MERQTKGYLMVAAAGILWGTIGLQVKTLLNYQLSVQAIVLWRMIFAVMILFPFIFFTKREILKVDLRGIAYFSLIGICSQFFFNVLYFSAIQKTTIATAVTLLYSAPIFIAVMARIFYKELFTPIKTAALFLCMGGCFFASTGGSVAVLKLNLIGVLMGLGAGFTFALLTIIIKAIINDYHQLTIIAYSIGFGLLFYLPFTHPLEIFQMDLALKAWLLLCSLGLISTVIAYGFYITGLSYGIEASKAGIISTLEVVVSVMLSYLVFKEALWGWKLLGILMVVFSVVIVQVDKILPSRSPSP
ncbi:DMT family transporter [bacterium]|nr:EamA family transporter [Candidatus Atribacteria bacterium]MBU4047633.1 DMT family transporter [bacterium]MBU4562037.1 DMT family transporter [bacterium]